MQSPKPSLGRIVHYVGKQGVHARRAAIVSCSLADIVEGGDVQPLDDDMHVHLAVFTTPSDPAAVPMFAEFNVPYDENGAPGTWSWVP